MAEITLITGGARSGKSRFAEDRLKGEERVLYIATAIASDKEMEARIRFHRVQRNPAWHTLEAWSDLATCLAPVLQDYNALLLDCVTIMVTNLMLADPALDWDTIAPAMAVKIEKKIYAEFSRLLDLTEGFHGRVLLVTNELGMGLVPPYPLGRYFRDIAGRVNQKLAAAAETVYLLVSGIPVCIKGAGV